MSKLFLFASLSIVLGVGVVLTGCSQQPGAQPDAPQDQSAVGDQPGHEHGPDDHAGHELEGSGHAEHADHGEHGQYEGALAELSPADRELAEKQEVCPVSGEPLGSMGTPYKVTVEGREVLLCCQGCEAQIKEDPDKYLAKLPQ